MFTERNLSSATTQPAAIEETKQEFTRRVQAISKQVLSWKSLWLLATAVWLQGVVIIFIVLVVQRGVQTPVTDWLNKAIDLLGM
ncbi:MAG: hypothetical protein ACREQ7_17740 [Candidatus Binatia bacterium]